MSPMSERDPATELLTLPRVETSTRSRSRPSAQFVAGVCASLVLHTLLLGLLLRSHPFGALPTVTSTSAMVVDWQVDTAQQPAPPAPPPQREVVQAPPEAARTEAATAPQPQERVEAVILRDEGEQATAQESSAMVIQIAEAHQGQAAPAESPPPPAPSAEDAYLWDVLAHLRRFQQYPERARQRDVEGTVWLRARVSREGVVLRSVVERSSGDPVLDRAAARLIAQASPLPLPPKGAFAITDLQVPVQYRLRRR
jgi:periplasmic protein TonB